MRNRVLIGVGRSMIPVPKCLWQRAIRSAAHKTRASTRFMGDDHHRVRDFVVTELPRRRKPLSPDDIAAALGLKVDRTIALLEELERRLTFLFRNESGNVTWAYPVTVNETPHHGVFTTGEQAYSPWAADTLAMPFVQGQLQDRFVSVLFTSECAHCSKPLHVDIDSDLRVRVHEPTEPLIFIPYVDFAKLEDPSIIGVF